MIEKIINVLVIAAMVLVANYPIYANLKDTASEVNGIARDITVSYTHLTLQTTPYV